MRNLAAILALLFISAAAAGEPPKPVQPELKPTLSVFKPAKDDDGLGENAVIGEAVPVPARAGEMRGAFASPEAAADYEIFLTRPQTGQVTVEYRFTWKGKPDALVVAHGIRIPFAFGPDARRTKVIVGAPGRPRGETWWVDQNDMWHIYWMLSDQKERWPLWRLGGITQESPDRFVIWKANRPDTPPLIVDRGLTAPGWLDVSDTDHGVTVVWEEMPKRAPCAIEVNYPAKEIDVWFHPPSSALAKAESLGYAPGKPITWKFTLAYHDDVFPATQARELTRPVYTELLRLIDEQKLWQYVAMNYLVPISGDLDTRIRQAIDTGIQPSEILANFDTGNAWRMQKMCTAVGKPYSKDHAANVKAVLDYCSSKIRKQDAETPRR